MTKEKSKKSKPAKGISRREYDKKLKELQAELCHVQAWVKEKGLRVAVVFEGRDAAGKGGVIKRITERVSPRVFRVVALPTPTERQKTQMHIQRYVPFFPAAGEIMLFDRSWYNRAGVEHVMGFCTEEQYEHFLVGCPLMERSMTEDGIILIKYFFDVSPDVQEKRFNARAEDPRKHWKLSPMDIESWARWWEYTAAYDRMIRTTDNDYAPWYRVIADDKRAARLNCIEHLLSQIPYEKLPFEPPQLPEKRKRSENTPDNIRFLHTVPQIH